MKDYDGYYVFLVDRINCNKYRVERYTMLLKTLYDMEFYWVNAFDQNRALSGLNLRKDYEDEFGGNPYEILDGQCSVLEMMVALSIDCEEKIMGDVRNPYENNTPRWFWSMIENVGLADASNINYDEEKVRIIFQRILNREYEWNGDGSLFPIIHPMEDMRNVEIWYQLNWWLNEQFPVY